MRQRTEDNALCPWDPQLSRWFLPARPCLYDARMMTARCDVCNVGDECHTEPSTFVSPCSSPKSFVLPGCASSSTVLLYSPPQRVWRPSPPMPFQPAFSGRLRHPGGGPFGATSDLRCRPESFGICFPQPFILRMTTAMTRMTIRTARTIRR